MSILLSRWSFISMFLSLKKDWISEINCWSSTTRFRCIRISKKSTKSTSRKWRNVIAISMTLSRNRVQVRYRKSYRSNRGSKQRTHAMIVLVERYCKTCICLSLSTSRNDIYTYTRKTPPDSSIIGPDPGLFPLTNYLVRMVRAVSRHSFPI